jgi:hypothetical protein
MTKRKPVDPATICTAYRDDGQPCKARRLPGREHCLFHDPARAGQLVRARWLGGKRRRRKPPVPPDAVALRDYESCFALVEEAARAALRLESSAAQAQLLRSIAMSAAELVEMVDNEKRIRKLEEDAAQAA